MRQQEFSEGVMRRLDASAPSVVAKSLRFGEAASAGPNAPPVGHPLFAALTVGQMETCSLAISFIDMCRTTARSFWQPLPEVARLSLAVLGQVAEVVQESGGHVLGLRGDGLMAGWGDPTSDAHADIALAMAASAFSLDAVQNSLNQTLQMSGIAPVQIRAGADWGNVCFVRTGTEDASEINIVGHPANFAAKCEKHAKAWEIVVGEGAAQGIDTSYLTRHERSPKTYTHEGERREYHFYDLRWRPLVGDAATAIAQVGGRPTSSIDPYWEENQS